MGTLLSVSYRGNDIPVLVTTMTTKDGKVIFLCQMPEKRLFEIELTTNAVWVIVGDQVISASLVELIGDAYVNSILP